MEVLREEDERTLAATSPHSQLSGSESRKNSSNFGVRTYIPAPPTVAAAAGNGIDEDDGLLLDANDNKIGAEVRRTSSRANVAVSRSERLLSRWRAAFNRLWMRIRRLVYNYIAPMLYRVLTCIRWQILLTVGCVILCTGIVLMGIGLIYHDHQVLFPKDHEIQYLSVADWRLNRRFRALRSIGAILFGTGGGLALAALGISVLSKCKQRRQQQHRGTITDTEDDDDRMSSTSTGGERRLFQVTSSYQPIEPNNNSGGPLAAASSSSLATTTAESVYGSTTTTAGTSGSGQAISFQLDSTKQSSRRKSDGGGKKKSNLSKPRKSIQPHQELPQFPTGDVSVEAVQMSRKSVE